MTLVKKTFKLSENLVFECYILLLTINNVFQFWFMGTAVTKFLEYANPHQAIIKNVIPEWRKTWLELKVFIRESSITNAINTPPPPNWQPHTVFISEPGVYALISRSKKTEAKNFQRWLFEEVLPSLRHTGRYDMDQLIDPSMSTSSSASQQVCVWEKERAELLEKNNKIQLDLLTTQLESSKQLALVEERMTSKITRLQEQALEYVFEINKLKNLCMDWRNHANNMVIERAKNGLLAQYNIVENDTFRNNLNSIVGRVVPKSPPLKEHYNVCYMYTKGGVTHYKSIRAQLLTIQKYERQIVSQSSSAKRPRLSSDDWLTTAVEISRMKVPNPVSFWNNLRQRFPEVFYGVRYANGKAKTDIVYLSEAEVRLSYRKHLEVENVIRNHVRATNFVSGFGKFAFLDEEDAVRRCFTAEENTREKTISMLEIFRKEIEDEIVPQIDPIRNPNDFTNINIVNYIPKNIMNVNNCLVEFNINNPHPSKAIQSPPPPPPPSPNKDFTENK